MCSGWGCKTIRVKKEPWFTHRESLQMCALSERQVATNHRENIRGLHIMDQWGCSVPSFDRLWSALLVSLPVGAKGYTHKPLWTVNSSSTSGNMNNSYSTLNVGNCLLFWTIPRDLTRKGYWIMLIALLKWSRTAQ